MFDTRGLSVGNTGENVQLLKDWVKKGVTDSQAVVRLSDGQEGRDAIQVNPEAMISALCKCSTVKRRLPSGFLLFGSGLFDAGASRL